MIPIRFLSFNKLLLEGPEIVFMTKSFSIEVPKMTDFKNFLRYLMKIN